MLLCSEPGFRAQRPQSEGRASGTRDQRRVGVQGFASGARCLPFVILGVGIMEVNSCSGVVSCLWFTILAFGCED